MYQQDTDKNTLQKIAIAGLAVALVLGAVFVFYPADDKKPAANKMPIQKNMSAPVIIPAPDITSAPEITSEPDKTTGGITFQDKELERLIKSALRIENRDILPEDIDDIEVIDVVGCFIQMKKTTSPYFGDDIYCHGGNYYIVNGVRHEDSDRGMLKTLADLKQFPHLTAIMLEYQDNPDISTVPDIQSLRHLKLFNDNIKDISVLADAKQLKSLNLAFNPISDYSPLDGLSIARLDEEYWTNGD
jgi:hypothetical protein